MAAAAYGKWHPFRGGRRLGSGPYYCDGHMGRGARVEEKPGPAERCCLMKTAWLTSVR